MQILKPERKSIEVKIQRFKPRFRCGAPLSPDEIQENISHYILDIENANLQRITRHLLKNIKINSLRILQQVHTIIILQVD